MNQLCIYHLQCSRLLLQYLEQIEILFKKIDYDSDEIINWVSYLILLQLIQFEIATNVYFQMLCLCRMNFVVICKWNYMAGMQW